MAPNSTLHKETAIMLLQVGTFIDTGSLLDLIPLKGQQRKALLRHNPLPVFQKIFPTARERHYT